MKKITEYLKENNLKMAILLLILNIAMSLLVTGYIAVFTQIIFVITVLYLTLQIKEVKWNMNLLLWILLIISTILNFANPLLYAVQAVTIINMMFRSHVFRRTPVKIIEIIVKLIVWFVLIVSAIFSFFIFQASLISGPWSNNSDRVEKAWVCKEGIITSTGEIYNPGAMSDCHYTVHKTINIIDFGRYLKVKIPLKKYQLSTYDELKTEKKQYKNCVEFENLDFDS